VKENPNADMVERAKYRDAVEKLVNENMTNLNGFELLDSSKRYDIVFYAGWKKETKQEKK
jgi:hypothetical protein